MAEDNTTPAPNEARRMLDLCASVEARAVDTEQGEAEFSSNFLAP
jgi:hypothetical protein